MLYYIARLIYILIGWQVDKEKALSLWESKTILIGFPHTSVLDTFVTMVGIFILKKKSYTFIKKEAFFWPLSLVLKMNKAIPVDRNSSRGIVSQENLLKKTLRSCKSFMIKWVISFKPGINELKIHS